MGKKTRFGLHEREREFIIDFGERGGKFLFLLSH